MEGAGTIMSAGVVQSVAPVVPIEAPKIEGFQNSPQIVEAKKQSSAPSPEDAVDNNPTAQKILDSAKDEGYDTAFEKLARGDFEDKKENESGEFEGESQATESEEKQPEEMELRVQALENRVSSLLQENMKLKQNINAMKDLYAFTLEELLAFAILLRKRLEGKTEEDEGLLDVLISLIGKLFQAMVEPEVITGEKASNKAA